MDGALQSRRILVVGRESGIARAITLAVRAQGGQVVVAGRNRDKLARAYDDPGITAEDLDVTDDGSIEAFADRVGHLDHVVSTASARARGTLPELHRKDVLVSLNTKLLGPLMLAKHLAPRMDSHDRSSFVLFSGVHAFKAKVGYLGVGITNGAVDFLTRALAVELAPIRVNAVSPGVIDTGAWDAMGDDGKRQYFHAIGAANPVGRIGTVEDIAQATVFAMTNTFITGVTLRIDGGEPLA